MQRGAEACQQAGNKKAARKGRPFEVLAKRAKVGGAKRDRTADLLHAMQALSQLSYGP
jgi:hypothetical protein